jgi:hypothetical protein
MEAKYDHVDGLTGREPVGAVLRIGQKAPQGFPTDTDRFFITSPQAEQREFTSRGGKKHSAPFRELHPDFDAYHALPPERRRSIRGNLTHASRADCELVYLRAQQLEPQAKWPNHPNMLPSCTGDGEKATRYFGLTEDGADDFREIPCPNDRCEFRISENRQCKPFGRLYFRPNWRGSEGPPAPLMKLVTGSWNSCAAMKGFFDYVESQAQELGIAHPNLFGLPFLINLQKKSDRRHKRAFPILTFTPEIDLIAFFVRQQAALESVGAKPLELPESVHDVEPAVDVADYAEITPTKPGQGGLFDDG